MTLINETTVEGETITVRTRQYDGGFTVHSFEFRDGWTPPVAEPRRFIDMSKVGAADIERMVEGKSEEERAYLESRWDRVWGS